jgi:hypothetical protein
VRAEESSDELERVNKIVVVPAFLDFWYMQVVSQ